MKGRSLFAAALALLVSAAPVTAADPPPQGAASRADLGRGVGLLGYRLNTSWSFLPDTTPLLPGLEAELPETPGYDPSAGDELPRLDAFWFGRKWWLGPKECPIRPFASSGLTIGFSRAAGDGAPWHLGFGNFTARPWVGLGLDWHPSPSLRMIAEFRVAPLDDRPLFRGSAQESGGAQVMIGIEKAW
jgi:hypothetical protein